MKEENEKIELKTNKLIKEFIHAEWMNEWVSLWVSDWMNEEINKWRQYVG